MEEGLTSSAAPETTSVLDSAPVDSGQSTEQSSTASSEPQPRTESSETSASADKSRATEKQSVNLYDLPEFRQYQSQTTRQQQQREQQMQGQLQQYERRMQELEDANLDDFGKEQKRAERAEAKLYEFQQSTAQEKQQGAENQRILDDMQRISDKTGVPLDDLFNAENYDDALDMGLAYMKEQGESRAKEEEAKKKANRTVIGGGKASTPDDRTTKRRNELLANKDGKGFVHDLLYGED